MKLSILLVVLMALCPWVSAGNSDPKGDRLEAHVHGTSELMIAIEGKDIEIEFESPAMNLLGFEHQANSAKDKAAVKSAVAALKKYESIFTFSESSCRLVDLSVDASSVISGDDEHEHHDKHEHEDTGSRRHSEITASYHFKCEQPNKLSSINVNLFQVFPGIHEIKTMWLSEIKQGAETLTSKSTTIGLR